MRPSFAQIWFLTATLLVASGLGVARGAGSPANTPVFRTDVMAAICKAGCNMGSCHGNATGKGGFKLSLRGQDAALDWAVLTREQEGRRVNLVEPEKSLILLKATGSIAHEGGTRFPIGSPEYTVLLDWLKAGGKDSSSKAPKVTKLTVTPAERVLVEPVTEVKLSTTATFSDGTQREVSRFAVYEPNNQGAKVSVDGLVSRVQVGETTILVRYLDQQVPVHISFVPARPDFAWRDQPAYNYIDAEVDQKLKVLRMNPSPVCSDDVFLRRAYLDLLGLVPPPDVARKFVADKTPDKRAKLVDQLLERDEFADFWALKWSDLMKMEPRTLDPQGVRVFHDWIRASIKANKPMDQFAREIVAARGSTYKNPPANWWRANRDPATQAENTASVFLGTQLKCAQCHNHPFERWTQDDYYNWASLFSRIDYKITDETKTDKNDKHEFKGDQEVLIKPVGFVVNPRTGDKATPKFLGAGAPATTKDRDELLALADWLSKSPMFARTQVNRVWANLLGRGLVDPVDDFRASNPPSHPALLDALTKDFTGHGYDLRHLIRVIMGSRTYQLSAEPNATNSADEANFSHALVRRLGAEQLVDSISQILAVPLDLEGVPRGTRLAQHPEGRKYYRNSVIEVDRFAATFGKPPRLIASDCERTNDVALPQVFQMISGPFLQTMLTNTSNRLSAILEPETQSADLVEKLYWLTLTRPPTKDEATRMSAYFNTHPDLREAAEDVTWALLNSKEFLFRR